MLGQSRLTSLATTTDITYFAETNYRGIRRPFGIKRDDRRRHMYVVGKTGMGKSTLLENLIAQDIRNGEGLAVIDPHGDLVERVLSFVPKERINDVVYIDPADVEYPVAFNVLQATSKTQPKNLIASGLISVFKKIWADSWGPRLEYILRNTVLALLEYPDATLLGVPRMYVDAGYRRSVVERVRDPVVRAFWTEEFQSYEPRFRAEAVSPIQNKIGQFLSSAMIRGIVEQPRSTIDLRRIMDSRKILLLNLAKGRIGEDNGALLGALIITKIQLAAMSRIDTPEANRADFFLYVDEFQNFATESFASILSEARKYRLGLVVAHQYTSQLEDQVREAVFGNVGTLIAFRIGAADAKLLAEELTPVFLEQDFMDLPQFEMYLRLMIDGTSSVPFSASGLPPAVGTPGMKERVVRVSKERYGLPRAAGGQRA